MGIIICDRGSANYNLDRYYESIQNYQKALEINSKNSEAYRGLGYMYS